MFQSAWPNRTWCTDPKGWTDEVAECVGKQVPLNTAPKAVERFRAALDTAGLEWPAGDGIP